MSKGLNRINWLYFLPNGNTGSPVGRRTDELRQIGLLITPRPICSYQTLASAALYGNRIVAEGDPKFCAGGRSGEDTCQVVNIFGFY